MPDAPRVAVRAADFRFVPSDVVGFQFSDNGVKLVFAVEDVNGTILEQSGATLPLPVAKILHIMLGESLKRYEERVGQEVYLDPIRLAEVMKVFEDADAKRAAESAS